MLIKDWMSFLFLSMFYIVNIFLFLNFNSTFIFWFLMEMNMICFILIIIFSEFKQDSSMNTSMGECLYYLFIQSLGSFIFLFTFIFNDYMMFSLVLTMVSIIIKMGLFPFHFWIYNFSWNISNFCFFMLLTFQKFPYIFFLLFSELDVSFYICLINLIFGSILTYLSLSLKQVLLSSSIYSTFWLFIILSFSINSFFMFFISYASHIYFLCKTGLHDFFNYFFFLFSILFLLSVPPLSFFFFKIYSISFFFLMFSEFSVFIVWISVFLMFVSYFIFFFKKMFLLKLLYNFNFFSTVVFKLMLFNFFFIFLLI